MTSPHERGYRVRRGKYLHISIVENVIGKPLPKSAVVHHVDCDPTNNANSNLVVCQDQKYHFLLHRRQRAIDAGYPAHFLRCNICKTFGSPAEMYIYAAKGSSIHKECQRAINKERILK